MYRQKGKKTSTVSFRINTEYDEALRAEAEEKKVSMNTLVNQIFGEYVDWNKGEFKSTGGNIADDIFSITPAISWRPAPQTVFRFNYRYGKQKDLLGNPPSTLGAIQFGLSTYF